MVDASTAVRAGADVHARASTCTRGGLEEETAAHIVSVHYEDIS